MSAQQGKNIMRHLIIPVHALLSLLLVTTACTPVTDPDLPILGGAGSDRGYEPALGFDGQSTRMAIIDWRCEGLESQEDIEAYARAEVVVFETGPFWTKTSNAGIIDAMKAVNPDVKVLGYFPAHGSWLFWQDADAYPSGTYGGDWFAATKPYWSRTTEADTAFAWPNQILLNVLEPGCRAAMSGVIADHWYSEENTFDGILWDHFNDFLWVPFEMQSTMDLDRDGVPHREDEDEMAAYRAASEDLIERVRHLIGDDVIQIANGYRAPRDSLFAGLLDGIMYEDFPLYGFSSDQMRAALDPAVSNNLFAAHNWPRTRNGGPYLLLTNKSEYSLMTETGLVNLPLAEFNRIAAMMTDNLVVFHSDQRYSYGWPELEFDLGLPTSGVTIDGSTMRRDYENGHIWLEMTTGNMPSPFHYQVVRNDEVVQEYAGP